MLKKTLGLFSTTLLASTTLLGAGGVFAGEVVPSPDKAETPITAELTIEDPEKPTPPTDPDQGGGDDSTEIIGLFGIAYAPSQLSAKEMLNNNSEEQRIALAKDNKTKYNVGVQDKTRKNDQSWSLKAQLSWTGEDSKYMQGTTISATGGNVKENVNGKLQDLTNSEVTTAATNLNIGQESQVEVMKSTKGATMNGVYNYQFSDPELVIPTPDSVASGSYTGNITWNLSNVME
ncbi:hypothetical protein IGJ83_003200 [Enterococcus pernyi]